MRSFYLALVLLVFTTACTKVTSIRYNPGYNNVLSKHQEVIILPPAAEVNTVDIGGKKKRVYNYEANLEQLIAAETNTDLQELGFNVKVMHRKDFHDLGIYDHYLRLRDTYDTARRELYQPLLWEESNIKWTEECREGSGGDGSIWRVCWQKASINEEGIKNGDIYLRPYLRKYC
jgi:hypothetical protein